MRKSHEEYKQGNTCRYCSGHKEAGVAVFCKECQKMIVAKRREKRREKKEKARQKGICWQCEKETVIAPRARCSNCCEKRKIKRKQGNRKIKQQALDAYGGAKCVCCGETLFEFLTIDHINGGGTKHREQVKGNLYSWYRRHGYPSGYQVMCMNCNFSKGLYGYCPHQSDAQK